MSKRYFHENSKYIKEECTKERNYRDLSLR